MGSYRLGEVQRRLLVWQKNLRHVLRHAVRAPEQQIVFVAGVQRSGTNMMMDVLERSFQTDVYHERDRRAFDNYQMRDIETIKHLVENSKAPCFIIKSLCELQNLHQLMQTFQPSKTVWVNRHYHDVANSMLVSFRNQAKQVLRIAKSRSSDDWWLGKGMSDETYAIVTQLAHPAISDASAAALIWYFRSVLFFEQGFDADPRVRLVQYESLVSDPHNEFRRVFDFLGLDYSARVSSRIFASSIKRRNPPQIEAPIEQLCAGLMSRFQAVLAKQSLSTGKTND